MLFIQIRNVETQNCLDTMGREVNGTIGSIRCNGLGFNQLFAYTKRHQILSDINCLDGEHPSGPVNMVRCNMGRYQEWHYDFEVSMINIRSRILKKVLENCLKM